MSRFVRPWQVLTLAARLAAAALVPAITAWEHSAVAADARTDSAGGRNP